MNEQMHESLSALMDGELEREPMRFLLRRMSAEPALADRWGRYHLARQVLRRQGVAVTADLAAGVMSRLEQDARPAAGRHREWLRWGAGGAIAASVAVAALVLTRPVVESAPGLPLAEHGEAPAIPSRAAPAVSVAATRPSGEFRAPLLVPNAPVETAPVNFGSDLSQQAPIDPRLQSYVIRHYEASGAAAPSVFVPYVLLSPPQRDERTPATDAQPR
jgi:sigma-E factor negative regulatory protein RseA